VLRLFATLGVVSVDRSTPYVPEFAKKDAHLISLKCLVANAITEVWRAALEVMVNLTNLQERSYFNLLMVFWGPASAHA
jgi:hypothetical protein